MRTGNFKESVGEIIALSDSKAVWAWTAALIAALIAAPYLVGAYALTLMVSALIAVIGAVGGVIAVLLIAVVLVLGFWQPGFFVTTKLDINKANAGVQQILTDETNGYGAKNVKDVKCNKGADPVVKKGGTFDCDVSIDGASKHVTVTFQDDKGTYEVGRPQ